MTENEISKMIVDAAVEVHRELGGPDWNPVFTAQMLTYLRLTG